MICDNSDLSMQDELLATLYKELREHPKFGHQLYTEQRAWLKMRNMCKSDACIMDKYQTRIAVLSNWIQEEKDKAKELETCTDRPECWPDGSAMYNGLVAVEELQEITNVMNIKHEELLTLISDSSSYSTTRRIVSALRQQQASWETYRGDECSLVGALTGAGGTWPSTYANRCEVELANDRLQRIESALGCIQDIPEEDRMFEHVDCIMDLTPLAKREPISI